MTSISYQQVDEKLRDLEVYIEKRITDHVSNSEYKVLNDFSNIEDSIIENLDQYLEDTLEEKIATKVIEKCLEINDVVKAILNSRDDDEIVREFCKKYMKDKA